MGVNDRISRCLAGAANLLLLAVYANAAHAFGSFKNVDNGVWSTGQSPVPVVLIPYAGGTLDAQVDPHYTLIKLPAGCSGPACQETNTAGDLFGPSTYVVLGPAGTYPFDGAAWKVLDDAASSWIGPRADQRDPIVGDFRYDHAGIYGNDSDFYVYRMTFNLTALGLDHANAQIQLRWLSDNASNSTHTLFSHIRMCGIASPSDPVCPESATVPGSQNDGQVAIAMTPVSITSGFTSGLMALDFVVYNEFLPINHNASGLDVAIDSATAGSLPAVTVSVGGTMSGTVTSDVTGISCPSDCSQGFLPGTHVTLTAAPSASGAEFMGWLGGGCEGTAPTCAITVTQDVSVRATFGKSGTVPTLDVDDSAPNAQYDALTDGVLVLRYLFGLTGQQLVADAVTAGAARSTPDAIAAYLADILPSLDVDGNGQVDALTDGLLILRKLFGVGGPSLTANAIGPGATRTPAEIDSYMQTLMP